MIDRKKAVEIELSKKGEVFTRTHFFVIIAFVALVPGCAPSLNLTEFSPKRSTVARSNTQTSAQMQPRQDERLLEKIDRLRPGKLVRVTGDELGKIEGRFLRRTETKLFLRLGDAEIGVSLVAIDALWVRGSAGGTGAIYGGIVVGLVGVGLGAALADYCADDGNPCPAAIPIGGLVGATAGAAVGAIIGVFIPKWHQRYP